VTFVNLPLFILQNNGMYKFKIVLCFNKHKYIQCVENMRSPSLSEQLVHIATVGHYVI